MKLDIEGLEMQKWNIPRWEKCRYLSSYMFTPTVMVIKISKMSHFLYFMLMAVKKLVTVWAKHLNVTKRSYWVLSENDMVNRVWNCLSWDIVEI